MNILKIIAIFLLFFIIGCNDSADSKKNTTTLFINSSLIDCNGYEGMNRCMEVKYNKSDEDWSPLYAHIEQFEYEENYIYEIIVETIYLNNTNIPDMPSYKYKLIKIVSKEGISG